MVGGDNRQDEQGEKFVDSFLADDTDEEIMATGRQKRTLTDLIFQNIDEDKREGYLQQLDDVTKAEATDLIMEFTMGRWR